MQATFILLLDLQAHNVLRKLSLEAHEYFGVGFSSIQTQPHLTLKGAFQAPPIPALERFFDAFAASVAPRTVTLTNLQMFRLSLTQGILYADVAEQDSLRTIHHNLNQRLTEQFGPLPVAFDGDNWHFHTTVAKAQGEPSLIDALHDHFVGRPVDLRIQLTHMQVLLYLDGPIIPGSYMSYKTLPVGTAGISDSQR